MTTTNYEAVRMGVREAAAAAAGSKDVLLARIKAAAKGGSPETVKDVLADVTIGRIANNIAVSKGRDYQTMLPIDYAEAAEIMDLKGAGSKSGPKRTGQQQKWWSAAGTYASAAMKEAGVKLPKSDVRSAAGKKSAEAKKAKKAKKGA